MDRKERNRRYVKKSRSRRNASQIYRDSNRYKTSLNNYITRCLGTAKFEDRKKGRDFSINREYVLELFHKNNGRCCVSNTPLVYDGSLFSVSIDRIDNDVGHIIGNIQLICMGLNLARNTGSTEDLLFLVDCLINSDLFVPDDCVSRDFVSSLRRNVMRGEDSDLTTDFLLDLFDKQGGRCTLSGIRMCCYRHPCLSLSVDRVDNDVGHVIGNVRLVLRALNRAKKRRSDSEFLSFLSVIRDNYESR